MAINTKNIDLVKPGVDEFYDVNVMNSNLDKIDSYTGEIKNKIDNGSIQNTTLQPGYNRIQIPEIPVSPKIEFTGFSYTNLLGKDGNCEDVSKWLYWQTTPTLDTNNKVFGNSSIKMTISDGVGGNVQKDVMSILNKNKYYLFTAYVKNGNLPDGANIVFWSTDGIPVNSVISVTDTTKFTRLCVKISPNNMATATNMVIAIGDIGAGNASPTQYAYMDGAMINEISADDYNNLSVDQLMAKYPYVDSYGCLTNPYFENRRYNLVRNGNCEEGIGYWTPIAGAAVLSVESGRFRLQTTSMANVYQIIKVRPNTNYYLSGNLYSVTANITILIYNSARNTLIHQGIGVFNSGNNTEIAVVIRNEAAGGAYFDSIMLVAGTTALTEYKSCDFQRFAVEGEFTADDTVTIQNGKVSGLLNWKHMTLYGKDYDWIFNADYTGFKRVVIPAGSNLSGGIGYPVMLKHEGALISSVQTWTAPDLYQYITDGTLFLTISDVDSGWTETLNPNNDEVKAFINGWKAVSIINNRYCAWTSIVDKLPPTGTYSTLALATVVGQYSMTVVDGSKFCVGRKIIIVDSTTGLALYGTTVSGINGNVITTGNALTSVYPAGTVVADGDDGVNDTTLLNYCKNNVSLGYEGYKLHYKLANPEPITDSNVTVTGSIWGLVKGDNYVTVDSGIVLGEVVNPVTNGSSYAINDTTPGKELSLFKNKNETIDAIYKNNVFETSLWTYLATSANGKYRAYIMNAGYDTNVTYTVDYQILKTLHAQAFGSMSLSYPQSIISALEGHSKALDQRQAKNSVLDDLIDLSMYEELESWTIYTRGLKTSANQCYAHAYIPIVRKKVKPIISIRGFRFGCYNGAGAMIDVPLNQVTFTGSLVMPNLLRVAVIYSGTDTNMQNNIVNNGVYIACGNIIMDCRGRI